MDKPVRLTKSDYLSFLHCAKSLWLHKHKPDACPARAPNPFMDKLSAEGDVVEGHVKAYLEARSDAASYAFQHTYTTDRGLYARTDVTRDNGDGTFDLLEVKSTTRVKQDHIEDAAFQTEVARQAGAQIRRTLIIHLNPDYVRAGAVDPGALITIVDVTRTIAEIAEDTRAGIDAAIDFINTAQIDENGCTCVTRTKSNHCTTFDYFNPDVPPVSIYLLPGLRAKAREKFTRDGRFGLDQITQDEVSASQRPVLQSAHARAPVIDRAQINAFFAKAQYPLYFLDYETYVSAIPIMEGARPQAHIPFQYSLHVKRTPKDDTLQHHEYLAGRPIPPLEMVKSLKRHIGPTGSVVSWYAPFENTQNAQMAAQYPDMAAFLNGLIARTIDLRDLFKSAYVDIAFGGSTSIKKVLPVLAPDLTYDDLAVSDGTAAMEAWARLIGMEDGAARDALRRDMLAYCKLDTYAMLRIYEVMERVGAGQSATLTKGQSILDS